MRLDEARRFHIGPESMKDAVNSTLKQMGHAGRKYLNGRRPRGNKAKQ